MRNNMARLLTVSLALMMLTIGAVAHAQDPHNLTVIQGGQAVEGTLQGERTAVMYGVNALEGNTLDITVTPDPNTPFTPLVVVFGPAGQVVATGEDQFTAPIEFTGSYFVMVTTLDAVDGAGAQSFSSPLEFTLVVTGNTPPPNAASNLAYFRTDLDYGTTFEGYSSPLEPVYYFIFEGTSSDIIDVVVTSGDIDPVVFLFDSRGERVAVNDDAETMILPSTTDAAIEGYDLPSTGLYFVFVTDISFYELPELTADDNVDVEDVFTGGDFAITVDR